MNPIRTLTTNALYVAEGCEDLPATQGEMQTDAGPIPIVETAWELSVDEIEEVVRTGRVYVRFIGTSIIPLCASTKGAFAEFEAELAKNPEFAEKYRSHFGIKENIEKE